MKMTNHDYDYINFLERENRRMTMEKEEHIDFLEEKLEETDRKVKELTEKIDLMLRSIMAYGINRKEFEDLMDIAYPDWLDRTII